MGLWRTPVKNDFNGLVNGELELGALEDILGIDGVVGSVVNTLLSLLGLNTAAPNSSPGSSPYLYAQYSASGGPTTGENAFGNASNSSNNLRFYYNGQVTNSTVLQAINEGGGLASVGLSDLSAENSGILGIDVPILPNHGGHAALWSSTQATDILNLGAANIGTWSYFGLTQGRTVLSDRVIAQHTAELLNGVEAWA